MNSDIGCDGRRLIVGWKPMGSFLINRIPQTNICEDADRTVRGIQTGISRSAAGSWTASIRCQSASQTRSACNQIAFAYIEDETADICASSATRSGGVTPVTGMRNLTLPFLVH